MAENLRSIYQALEQRLEEKGRLEGIMGIMSWDQEVIMPPGASESRARQMSTLAGIIHEKATESSIGNYVEQLGKADSSLFDEFEWCNIKEAKREYDMEVLVPKSLVQDLAELASRGHEVWVKARQKNCFNEFAPVLRQFIKLKKQWANYVDPHNHPYDVNIDQSERGATMAQIDPIFEKLKSELIPLIKSIRESGYCPDASFLSGEFPISKQRKLGERISKDMGFSFERGRMDISVHPFCGGGHPTDVRITTRYRKDNFVESIYAIIHESGHGLYEQGRMERGREMPASQALTMGIHESQSLFWERMIAQSKFFCAHYIGAFAKAFETLKGVSTQSFYEAINISHPSLIRVEADEVTYPLHVILRYEIEKGLFDGSIDVDDLPGVWNAKMEEYLGIRPPTDTLGVLQDIHWSGGAFGYFPSYTLGAIYACQFFDAMKKQIPDVELQIEQGKFVNIKQWLNKNIHVKGKLYGADELVRQITGEPLNAERFVGYLKKKYREIYRLGA